MTFLIGLLLVCSVMGLLGWICVRQLGWRGLIVSLPLSLSVGFIYGRFV